MSFHYGQGYPGGGQAPPFGAGLPPGGPDYQGGHYGGTAVPSAPPGPYDSSTPGYAPYGGTPPPSRGQYAGGQPSGTPYAGYGQSQGGPYGEQAPAGNIPPGVNPEAYQWFQSVDSDHSGFITLKELKQVLVNSNWSAFSDETCLMMINMFDNTRSGRMDVFGFSALWVFMQQWRSLFQQFDRDGSGCISGSELHQALSQMGYNLSPEFTQSLAARYSQGGTQGSMQLDCFIQVCTQLQSMTQAFREKDTAMTGNARISYEDFLTGAIVRLV
ncbi:hypothetical protein MATL_G00229690 [Megalops atlanticus]|uniref:Peflin n=1 Tax=Megalops atlanticus TaxID=7932 RepID=A0A9D3PHR2_MEGAT|nr:hypothetical protein MATL_G00229690 [Megalops atlanticus]